MPPLASRDSRRRHRPRRRTGVSLLEVGLKPGTRRRYRTAVLGFADWWDTNEVREGLSDRDYEQFDLGLSLYLQHLFDNDQGKSKAASTIYGLYTYLPHAKGKLLMAERMLKNWSRAEKSVPYPPLTWSLTCALAVHMAKRFGFCAGLAALLAFDCLLRVGELCSLLKEDVAYTGDDRLDDGILSGTVIRIAATKTGPDQSVLVERDEVTSLLKVRTDFLADGTPLFPFSAATFRRYFKLACEELGLSSDYVPHSLRHGGCTSYHLRGHSVEDCMQRGRWATTKSTRHYIQAGRSLLLTMRSPKRVSDFGRRAARDILFVMLMAFR